MIAQHICIKELILILWYFPTYKTHCWHSKFLSPTSIPKMVLVLLILSVKRKVLFYSLRLRSNLSTIIYKFPGAGRGGGAWRITAYKCIHKVYVQCWPNKLVFSERLHFGHLMAVVTKVLVQFRKKYKHLTNIYWVLCAPEMWPWTK